MPTSTQRFRLVGEDDASRAFLEVAAAAKLLKSNMDDVSQASLGLTKMIGGAGLIPVAAAATAAVTELGTALGAAGGALGVFGLSAGGIFADMLKQQKAIKVTDKSLQSLTKGTAEYAAKAKELRDQQKAFNQTFGPAAKGYNDMSDAFAKFKMSTSGTTTKDLGKGFELIASVLPKLVPVSNAAGAAVGGLIDDLQNWTEGPAFAHLLHFLETSGPKDITAFGHSIGNVLGGLGGILGNFVGPGDHAAKTLEHLTARFDEWGHSKGVSDSVNKFLRYVSDNGPEIDSVFKSLAETAPKMAEAFGKIGSANLTLTSKFLSLVAGLPQKQFNLIAEGLFAIAAGSKAIAAVNGLAGAAGALGALGKGGKGILGKTIGSAGGLGVQKVFVVNMAEGGMGGGGGLVKVGEKGAIAAAASAAIPLVLASGAFAASVYTIYKLAKREQAAPASPGYRNSVAGMSPADTRQFNADRMAQMYGAAWRGPLKAVQGGLAEVKARAEASSRAIELTGPRAKDAARQVVAAIQTMNNRGTGLDALNARGAAASRTLDMIGPHARNSSATAVAAISDVASALAHIHDRSIKITADTSQAMANVALMRQQVDALHGKTIVIRAIGGHVTDNSQIGGGSGGGAAGGSGGGASTGKSAGFTSRAGYVAGRDYMDGLIQGIKYRQLAVQAAISKVTDALSKIRGKVSNLRDVRSRFRGTFGADSIFGQDFSHTTSTIINGKTIDGSEATVPGSIADVLAFQKQQRDKARQLRQDVKRVTALGLSKALVRQLESQGASGAATLHALASGSRSQIQQLNAYDKQTSASLRSAGMRAGNYVRGGSVSADLRSARKTERVLELLEHHLRDLAHSEKKGQTIVVEIDGEAVITAVKRRNKRKGVKSAGI